MSTFCDCVKTVVYGFISAIEYIDSFNCRGGFATPIRPAHPKKPPPRCGERIYTWIRIDAEIQLLRSQGELYLIFKSRIGSVETGCVEALVETTPDTIESEIAAFRGREITLNPEGIITLSVPTRYYQTVLRNKELAVIETETTKNHLAWIVFNPETNVFKQLAFNIVQVNMPCLPDNKQDYGAFIHNCVAIEYEGDDKISCREKIYASIADNRVALNIRTCAVTLLNTNNKEGHAQIIIERVDPNTFQYDVQYAHLTSEKDGPAVKTGRFPIGQEIACTSRSQTWVISNSAAAQMMKKVKDDAGKPGSLPFHLLGRDSRIRLPWQKPGDNCMTWAADVLKLGGITLPPDPMAVVFTRPDFHTPIPITENGSMPTPQTLFTRLGWEAPAPVVPLSRRLVLSKGGGSIESKK
jgi:hypothetical protein